MTFFERFLCYHSLVLILKGQGDVRRTDREEGFAVLGVALRLAPGHWDARE